MKDSEIIALYFARDEEAIRRTDERYGAFCRRIAENVLTLREDAEECVNDTWHTAWNRMPPTWPQSLRAFLGRITRGLAIDRFRANRAQKRCDGMELLLSELDDCVASPADTEQTVERRELTAAVERWLRALEPDERTLFLRRYWYGDAVKELAKECGQSEAQTAQRLRRLRLRLRAALGEEMEI
ncbi:MAG: sigma-70 family RNA polymerase sigma factor [Oscillospiraceae bacterium]|nr:sigma-70 family RNA polymerase sigma factor [Oscillospiraceae bacterium]